MSAQIKRWSFSGFGGVYADEEYGHIVDYTDHLAAMAAASAYDEEKERVLFEAEIQNRQFLGRQKDGRYEIEWVEAIWHGWKLCAKARAKAQ